MRDLGKWLLVLGALGFAAGCSSPSPAGTCQSDADCNAGQTCQSGTCASPSGTTGDTGCAIQGSAFDGGASNPFNACQACDPAANAKGWSNVADGTPCDAGAVCVGGSCTSSCVIDGASVDPDAGNPANPCERCDSAASASTWSPRPDGAACGTNQICVSSVCQAGCFIDGQVVEVGSLDPANPCEACDPASNTQAWTPTLDGPSALCPAGQQCHAGACTPGCNIQGVAYPAGTGEPGNDCLFCDPATNPSAWTPGHEGSTQTCSAGQACHAGQCTAGCAISGVFAAPGAVNPANPCETCQNATSTSSYTPKAEASGCNADGQHFCRSNSCVQGCKIAGTVIDSGAAEAGNACQTCQPSVSATDYSPLTNGHACGAAHVCFSGACSAGCYISGGFRNPGDTNAGNTCQSCKPSSSTTLWTDAPEATACTTSGGSFCHDTGAGNSTCQAGCAINGVFYAPNQADPANPCLTCQPSKTKIAWSYLQQGDICAGGSNPLDAEWCQPRTGGLTCVPCPPCGIHGNVPCCDTCGPPGQFAVCGG